VVAKDCTLVDDLADQLLLAPGVIGVVLLGAARALAPAAPGLGALADVRRHCGRGVGRIGEARNKWFREPGTQSSVAL